MAYRAGTAFVAVSPSLRGFQTKITAEAKRIRAIDVPANLKLDDGEARAKLAALGRPRDATVNVNADTGAARAQIEALTRPRKMTVNVDADTGAARAKIAALAAGGGGIGLGGALAIASPVIGVAGGAAVGAAGGLAAIGAGAIGGGLAGAAVAIGYMKQALDLQKKLQQATQARASAMAGVQSAQAGLASAVRSADQTAIAGARAVADAERAVADARRNGARAIQAAEQSLADARRNAARVAQSTAAQIKAAQQAVAAANGEVKRTEQDLHKARQQSIADMQAMRAQVHADVLEVEAAQFAALDANAKLADVQANIFSTSDDIARARLAAAQAEQQVGDARRKSAADSKALADAEKNGTPAVQAAQLAVAQAVQARRQAVQQLAQTERSAAQQRADAARQVAQAEKNLGQTRADAARSVADAQRNLARARADAAAQNAAAQAAELAAKKQLADATKQESAAEAARLKLLNAITPGQKRALAALNALKRAWHGFILNLDKPISNALVAGFHAAGAALKPFGIFLRPVLHGLTAMFGIFQRFSNSKWAKSFSRVFGVFSGGIIRDMAHGIVNLAKGFGNLLRAFMPLGRGMSKGLVGLTRDFAHWARGLSKSKAFQDFIDWIKKNGPTFLSVLGKVGGALVQVGIALAPLGVAMVKIIGKIADFVKNFAKAHPTLTRIIAVVVIAVAIFSALAGPIAAVVTAVTLLISPIGAAIAIVALLVAGLIYAYKHSATFRGIVLKLWAAFRVGVAIIKKDVIPVIVHFWHHVMVPAFRAIGHAIAWAWNNVIHPVLKALWWFISKVLAPVIKWLWQHIVVPAFKGIWKVISFAWNNVIKPIFKALWWFISKILVPVIQFLWNKVVKPVFTWIGGKIHDVWNNVIKPVFNALKDGIRTVRDTFKTVVAAIGNIWDNLKKLAATPVRFVVNTVLAGLANAANKIPSVHVPVPHVNFARGGVMPGYTPGRDVHHFYSPTGGRLSLSGGEAIMRPEFTDMVGGERGVHALNKRARELRRRGIHHLDTGFAGGGIFRPTAGGSYGSVHDQWTGFPAVDIGVGTGTPVHSVAPGHVIVSQDLATSYGHWIKIAHAGFQSLYAHLRNRLVGVGRQVAGGQLIGYSDSTGNSTGPHLHFGVHGRSPLSFMHASTNYGSAGSAPGAGGGVSAAPVSRSIFNPLSLLHLSDWKDKLRGMGDWGHQMAGTIGSIVPDFVGWAKDKITSAFGKVTGWLGSHLHIPGLGSGPTTDSGSHAGIKTYAKSLFGRHGWSGSQFGALDRLWTGESGWRWNANNPNSSAYGIPQALPGSKMASAGADWRTNPQTQVRWGENYIKSVYGTPSNAYSKWLSRSPHWYDKGGYIPPGLSTVYNGTGRPEPVLTSAQWRDLGKIAGGNGGPTRFDLYDADGSLIGRMKGIARDAVDGAASFSGTRVRAGMGEDW